MIPQATGDPMLVERIDALLEKEMSPFKRKGTLKDGPRGRTVGKKDEWDCTVTDGDVTCIGKGDKKGQTKKWTVKKSTKDAYNADYKQHRPYKLWRSKVRAERDKK